MGVTEFFDTPSELIAPQEPVGVPPVVAVFAPPVPTVTVIEVVPEMP